MPSILVSFLAPNVLGTINSCYSYFKMGFCTEKSDATQEEHGDLCYVKETPTSFTYTIHENQHYNNGLNTSKNQYRNLV